MMAEPGQEGKRTHKDHFSAGTAVIKQAGLATDDRSIGVEPSGEEGHPE